MGSCLCLVWLSHLLSFFVFMYSWCLICFSLCIVRGLPHEDDKESHLPLSLCLLRYYATLATVFASTVPIVKLPGYQAYWTKILLFTIYRAIPYVLLRNYYCLFILPWLILKIISLFLSHTHCLVQRNLSGSTTTQLLPHIFCCDCIVKSHCIHDQSNGSMIIGQFCLMKLLSFLTDDYQ